MNFLQKNLYFIGGKGGVGKSTTSAAFAYYLSTLKKNVLLVSTDPAHNTGDLFHVQGDGKIQKIQDGLHILEIDSERENQRYISDVKNNLRGLVKSTMVQEVHRQIDLAAITPGAEEAALFDKITSIIVDELPNYDAIVFDTAPTGHTIRLLTLPELMGVWMDGMLERRKQVNEKNFHRWMGDGDLPEDPIYEKLLERKNRFIRVRDILLDSKKTEFLFVLNAERLPILETKKAIDTLHQYHIHVNTIVVNKLIPAEADGEFLNKRKENEQGYLQDIENIFTRERKIKIPLLESDISTFDHLVQFASLLKTEFANSEINV